MTVSGSTDFSSTAVQFVTDARRALGVNAEEEPLDNAELQMALPFLTRMLKQWEADPDLGTWLITTQALTLVQGQTSYLFGAGGDVTTVPFGVLSSTPVTISRAGGSDIPMTKLSRGDYARLPNKTTQGCPVNWFYDRQRDNGRLYVWPVCDATASTLSIPVRRRIMDVDNSTDSLDVPQEWEHSVVFNLAKLLIPTYGLGGTEDATRVSAEADSSMQTLKRFDISDEDGSVFIEADEYPYGYR